MGKTRNRKKAAAFVPNLPQVDNKWLRAIHWNANGILRDTKIELLADVLVEEDIDICFIDESHLVHGTNDNLSCLNQFTVYTKERAFGSKKGGGKMIILKQELNHTRWDPGLVMFPYLDAERSWILVHENGRNLAFCSVYCAAEVTNDQYKVWNSELYTMIQQEMATIQQEGFDCIILGDLNGHIGNDARGIEDNAPDINYNGTLLRDFISNTNLVLLNADKTRCSGVFTRRTMNSTSCLDYVLADAGANESIVSLTVDLDKEVLWGSDHSSLLLELNMGIIQRIPHPDAYSRAHNPSAKTASTYASTLDRLLVENSWSSLNTDEKCDLFQTSAVEAAALADQNVKIINSKRFSTCKSIRKLRTRCIKVEASISKKERWALSHNIDPNIAFPNIQLDRDRAKTLKIRFKEQVRQRRADKRLKLQLTVKINSKQFWALVKRSERKKGSLSAIKDEHGNLLTNKDLVEKIVLEQLSLIFSGKKSTVFSHRNEQLIKEVQAKSNSSWHDWIIPENDENMYEPEVCAPVSVLLVKDCIDKLKINRAPGVDNVTSSMLKLAGPEALNCLTSLINGILHEGQVPEVLNTGKMTLIDKKKPSLQVSGKRPLTVSSVILNLVTKIIHSRMDKICETEGFYGTTQFGFRKGRSTSDCVFILLAAIRRAKKRNHTVSLAFCDIAKAYDSVNRELLYLKLDSLGFGGKVKQIIQSMYYNDNVRVRLCGGLSNPLWFTRGVKQGCVLSPLLFSLYVSGLGKVLHSMKEGVHFSGMTISALFFADDLVLISRTKRRGMNRLLRAVQKYCTEMDMKLAVEKTVILSYGSNQNSWRVSDSGPDIEAALVAKYLGVDISVQGRNLIKPRESVMIGSARAYAHTIMGCTRWGLDRSLTAYKLWECCAIPQFLYGSEAMVISKSTVRELEKIQHSVASFILQLPQSSSQVMGWMEAGLKPIQMRLDERALLFAHRLISKENDILLKTVAQTTMSDTMDQWTRRIKSLLIELGTPDLTQISRASLKKRIQSNQIIKLQMTKQSHSSLKWLSEPNKWFKPNPQVNDSKECAALNQFKAGDAGLGNRRPNHVGRTYKQCPWCYSLGVTAKLDEQHVLLDCPGTSFARFSTGVQSFRDARSAVMSNNQIMKEFLGGDRSDVNVMTERGVWIISILKEWKRITYLL